MDKVLAVARRELRASFNTPVAYVVIVAFLVFTSAWLFFVRGFFAVGLADLRPFFGVMPIVLAFLAPALTMRSWAEERRQGTYELLLTVPATELELVLGKFLASYALLAAALLFTLPVPVFASMLGRFDVGVLVSQYLGVLLAGATATAIGQWVSSRSKNQVSAFVASALLILGLVLAGNVANFLGLPGPLAGLATWLSLASHYEAFARGVLDLRDLAYYLVVGAFALYLTAWNLRRRKWS